MKIKTAESELSQCLSAYKTRKLAHDLDRAFLKVDEVSFVKVILNHNVSLTKEIKEFHESYSEFLKSLNPRGKGDYQIHQAHKRKSNCIACELGKNIVVYEFEYSFPDAAFPYYQVVYLSSFGVSYSVSHGVLYDLKICNAYLSKNEFEKINESI